MNRALFHLTLLAIMTATPVVTMASECEDWVLYRLGLTVAETARLEMDSVLTAEFFRRLRHLETDIPSEECRSAQNLATRRLASFISQRWDHLLRTEQLEAFSVEAALLSGSFAEQEIPTPYVRHLHRLSQRVLEIVRTRLSQRLRGTPWAHWRAPLRRLELTRWSPEWQDALRTRANAAIDLQHNRVALDIFRAEPLELEIFLFHELAHSVHWREHAGEGSHANEAFAWQTTFAFADHLNAQNVLLPQWLVDARSLVQTPAALEAFAVSALRSRGIDAYRP